MRHRSERVRKLITDEVIPRTPSGGIALCHHHQRMVMQYKGFLPYLCRRVRWEAVGMAWGSNLIPQCPKCGSGRAYYVTTRKRFNCSSCGAQYSAMSESKYRCNKLPPDKINAIAAALASGASGLSVAKRFGVQVNTVYKIRDRARD